MTARRVFGWHTQIAGCAYYRVQLPLRTLREQPGWQASYGRKLPLTAELRAALDAGHSTAPARIAAYMAENYDVVLGQQLGAGGTGADQIWHAMARHRDRHGGPMLVMETDDDLTALHGGHLDEARQEMRDRGDAYRLAAQVADAVTCTTPALAERLQAWNGSVRVIPNYIDSAMFTHPGHGQHVERPGQMISGVRYQTNQSPPRWPAPEAMLIGWGGSSTHRKDFAVAWPALARLLAKRSDLAFASMGVMHHVDDPVLAKLERRGQVAGLRWMDMNYESWSAYWRRVGWFDVGLAPLEVNPFNEAKSWIKILEYCAMGVVPVASASPEYQRFFEGRERAWEGIGAVVGTEHGWYPALRAITSDWTTLRRMQAAARVYARQFTIQGHIDQWAKALTE